MPLCSIAKKPLGDWWFAVAEVSDTESTEMLWGRCLRAPRVGRGCVCCSDWAGAAWSSCAGDCAEPDSG